MSDFEPIPIKGAGEEGWRGQQAYQRLRLLLENRRIPHALLFTGSKGTGKRTAARTFAMALNCDAWHAEKAAALEEDIPCGRCRPCGKIISENHPDIHVVQPAGRFIHIEAIRQLIRTMAKKPYEARSRVAIVEDAEAMNVQASNALLKVLEEPPPGTVLILTAGRASDMLPTIISRCRQVRFNPIPTLALEGVIMDKFGMKAGDGKMAAVLANGSFTQAFEMAEDGRISSWRRHRDWLVRTVGLDPSDSGREVRRPLGPILAMAERLAKDKNRSRELLEILKTWLRDLVIYRYKPEGIIHKDQTDTIATLSRQLSVTKLLACIRLVETAQHQLQTNAGPRLVLEALLMRLAGWFPEPTTGGVDGSDMDMPGYT